MVEITKLDETEEAEDTTQAESDDSDTSENKAIVNVVEKSENASETSEIETETSEVNLAESLPVEDTQTNEIPDVDKAFGNFQLYFKKKIVSTIFYFLCNFFVNHFYKRIFNLNNL